MRLISNITLFAIALTLLPACRSEHTTTESDQSGGRTLHTNDDCIPPSPLCPDTADLSLDQDEMENDDGKENENNAENDDDEEDNEEADGSEQPTCKKTCSAGCDDWVLDENKWNEEEKGKVCKNKPFTQNGKAIYSRTCSKLCSNVECDTSKEESIARQATGTKTCSASGGQRGSCKNQDEHLLFADPNC